MAKIGLKYVVAGKYADNSGAAEYSEGRVLGKAISADISINITDDNLYADNEIAERVREFTGGTLALELDDLSLADQAWILGHSSSGASNDDVKTIESSTSDVAPYVGVGFYGTRLKNNIKSYRAIFLHKVMFGEPQETFNTKSDNIAFNTPKIDGAIDKLPNGMWKIESEFATEEETIAWLETKANITK